MGVELDTALTAMGAGICVIPPAQDGSKRPMAEWKKLQTERPTEPQLRAWFQGGRTGVGFICGQVSGGLEMLEFEGRAVDAGMLGAYDEAAIAAGLGNLFDHIALGYMEATPSGGVHLLYRCETPLGNTKLARRPATADELADNPGDPVKVLIETRGEGGYVIVAPSHGSVHPDGGAWTQIHGGPATIATITDAQRDALFDLARTFDTLPVQHWTPAERTHRTSDGDGPADHYNVAVEWVDLLEPAGWRRVYERGNTTYWRRPGKDHGLSASTNHDGHDLFHVFTSSTTFEQERSYTRFHTYAILHHHADLSAAGKALYEQGYGERREREKAKTKAKAPADGGGEESPVSERHLPDEFWNARPILEHVRQAARSRYLSPDAVLAAVLARVAACSPHTIELPATIGIACGLSYFAALTGPPEAGKSTGVGLAAELLPAPDGVLDRLPVGSGEGMVDVLFDMVEETDDKGKAVKVKRQTRHAAIFYIDEGAVLTDLASRKGSTILPTLRTAWTHGTLGAANASVETRRILDGRSYVYGVVLGIQPEKAAELLADANAGTPQRFVWLAATDPTAPDDTPEWPGPLPWTPLAPGDLAAYHVNRGGWNRYTMTLAACITQAIRADRLAVLRESEERAELDAHRLLGRVKTAGVLALLDHRMDVTEDDWNLAGMVVETSRNVRSHVVNTVDAATRRRSEAAAELHSARELHVDRKRVENAKASATKTVANIVRRHAKAQEHEGGCTRRCLSIAMSGRQRDYIQAEEAAALAEAEMWLEQRDGQWFVGPERP